MNELFFLIYIAASGQPFLVSDLGALCAEHPGEAVFELAQTPMVSTPSAVCGAQTPSGKFIGTKCPDPKPQWGIVRLECPKAPQPATKAPTPPEVAKSTPTAKGK